MCKASRYKLKRDDPSEVEGGPKRKKRPVKVVWYFPIIPRLMGLFANKDHAKLMRWHAEERRDDGNAQTPCGWLAVAEN